MDVKPGYKKTEIGIIPDSWRVDRVGQAFDICNNLRLPLSRTVRASMSGDFPYWGPTSIQGWINEFRVEGEYALIGEDGDHFLKWQDQSMTQLVRGRFNVNNHAHLVRGSENLTSWFYWSFANRDLSSFLTRQGAGRYKLTKSALVQIPCAIPPLPEQRAIATALSDVDALLGALQQLIAKKRDLKQAAMQQLLTGQTRLPGFTGEWEETTLGQIGECIIGLTYKPEDVVEHGLLVLRSSNVQNGQLAFDDNVYVNLQVADHLYTRPSDILICVRNGSRALIGKCTVIDSTAIGMTFGAFMSVYRTKYWRFVIHAFQAGDIQRQIRDNIGATINQITNKDMKAFRLKLPPEAEQTAIATVLSDMDAELSALEQRLAKTRALKQGMMQELLTGRTRLI